MVEANSEREAHAGHTGARLFRHTVVLLLINRDGMVRKEYYGAFIPEPEMISDITSLLP